MFESLSDRFEGIFTRLRGKGRLTDDDVDEVLREVRVALLEADVNVTVARSFINRVREAAVGVELSKALNPAEQVIKLVHQALVETLGGETIKITYASKPPTVVLMAGLQGSGKTTNTAKLARWFKEKGKRAVGQPGNLIMAGGTKSTAELVKGTQKGILVTRTWYIRMVDPQTVLLTGLTRDGTFYIENGQIKHPVKNFRFNESPVIMLNNIEELGRPVRVAGDESTLVMMIPPMKLRDFTFTSLSDAV